MDSIWLGLGLLENGNDGNAWRQNNASADNGYIDLLNGDFDRSNVDARRMVRIGGLEEHAVGDHREEEECHAAGDALDASEAGASGATEDGQPHVIVGELLTNGVREELLELRQVAHSSHWNDPFNHSIVLFHRQPTIADEEEPTTTQGGRFRYETMQRTKMKNR